MKAPQYDTVIVGAGFSGIGTAIKLDKSRMGNYLVIEAGDLPRMSRSARASVRDGLVGFEPSHARCLPFDLVASPVPKTPVSGGRGGSASRGVIGAGAGSRRTSRR